MKERNDEIPIERKKEKKNERTSESPASFKLMIRILMDSTQVQTNPTSYTVNAPDQLNKTKYYL